MMPPGIDLRNTREGSGAHSEFRVGIRDALHVGQPRGRLGNLADQRCHATIGRECSQFSGTFEVEPVAAPQRESPPPTLPWRAAPGSAAARFAGCSNARMKSTASSNGCRTCRAVGKYEPSGPNAIVGKRGCAWPIAVARDASSTSNFVCQFLLDLVADPREVRAKSHASLGPDAGIEAAQPSDRCITHSRHCNVKGCCGSWCHRSTPPITPYDRNRDHEVCKRDQGFDQ
jgi:hypothetical protein